MKLVKTTMAAFALSALLAGPVLAQGASPDTQMRGGVQGGGMRGGASGGADEDMDAQPGMSSDKAGTKTKGMKGTVGKAGSTKSKGTAGEPTGGSKRY